MAQFIITRDGRGVFFTLRSDKERTLVSSKCYATLDACKKGICSMVFYAPIVPLCDVTAGESGPNPKMELTGGGGAYSYALKAPNGKTVVEGGPYESKKACLRAISMLRSGVQGAPVVMHEAAQRKPLTVGKLIRDK
ncbi:MAG: DUF1508 domain-containing protein [Ruminococcaceae bacterium]|nr:DUF1508 domain-containing protein [Oscillospiraceae bacterium]